MNLRSLESRVRRLENSFGPPHICEELVIHTGVPRPGDCEPGTYRAGVCATCGRPTPEGPELTQARLRIDETPSGVPEPQPASINVAL